MQKALTNLPIFDAAGFRARIAHWKQYDAGPGSDRVAVEWGIGRGPSVFVYPAAYRNAGFFLVEPDTNGSADERWADFLEFDFVPQVMEAIAANGYRAQAICADLRPIQVQRARRRDQEKAAAHKTGHATH